MKIMNEEEILTVVVAGLNLFVGLMNMKFYFDAKNKGNLFWGVANLICFLIQCLVWLKNN